MPGCKYARLVFVSIKKSGNHPPKDPRGTVGRSLTSHNQCSCCILDGDVHLFLGGPPPLGRSHDRESTASQCMLCATRTWASIKRHAMWSAVGGERRKWLGLFVDGVRVNES